MMDTTPLRPARTPRPRSWRASRDKSPERFANKLPLTLDHLT
ncbi:hypothetical protein B005_3832 [Nocardiopsis alba ATCC BAA-2165]|uniref:Uncharacterized protein n=1 Tax=Nocardiopsis alba (strain ATCC BAA-2165 / BE74) TaxID=1205910 RepID=J7LAF1_NOCAA|nr:hypothetical protein B005_3832 [Nocardiopsis alba ATCC BAA-2165]